MSSKARFPKAIGTIIPQISVGGDANLVDVIVVKKAMHLHWRLATSFGATANRRLRMRFQSNTVITEATFYVEISNRGRGHFIR